MEDTLKKEQLIDELLYFGIYKKGNKQLFELPLSVLEEEYEKVIKGKGHIQNNES
ncbi:Fur-regulated basic protein FbpA [Cytobacillus sp. FJAT-54145]|uniref:Fur-regulated basic protein FbpA n=1 Tax=Cytobacillus spartinae TaxID=3299023 RepID=A0ABW6K8I4_9BACI